MLIVGIADRPSSKSFGIVPFIVRTDDERLLVAGHSQAEIDEGYLRWLYQNPIGAYDVSSVGARLDVFERGLVAGWIGNVFLDVCRSLFAPLPEIPVSCHAVPDLGCFWVGPVDEVRACRQRWTRASARLVVQTGSKELADLMKWADRRAPETEAAIWFTCPTEKQRDQQLQWFSQVRTGGHRRTKESIEAEIRRTLERLRPR